VALLTADDQHRPHVVDHFAHVDHALTATSFVRCNQQVDLAPVQRRPGRRYSLACRDHTDAGSQLCPRPPRGSVDDSRSNPFKLFAAWDNRFLKNSWLNSAWNSRR
jgi:hypothetical protein